MCRKLLTYGQNRQLLWKIANISFLPWGSNVRYAIQITPNDVQERRHFCDAQEAIGDVAKAIFHIFEVTLIGISELSSGYLNLVLITNVLSSFQGEGRIQVFFLFVVQTWCHARVSDVYWSNWVWFADLGWTHYPRSECNVHVLDTTVIDEFW